MVLGNVPKLHGFIALLAGVCAVPVGCSGEDFTGCEATRTCPSKGGNSGTGGEAGGDNDTGGSATGGNSGTSGTSGTAGTAGTAGTDNGGEGGTGGTTDDTDRPTIVSFSPDDGDVDVERDVAVTATFSEPIDAASVTATNVVLTGPDGDVPGALSVDGEVVSFVPERKLYLLGEYSLTIGDGVADLAGNTLGEEASVGFRVRDGRWSEPTFPFGETVPRVITNLRRNTLGDAIVGMTSLSNDDRVFAAIYDTARSEWTEAEELAGAYAVVTDMGIDPGRRGVVAWGTGSVDNFGWSRLAAGGQSFNSGVLGYSARLGVTSNGLATAVWREGSSLSYTARTQNLSDGSLDSPTTLQLTGSLIYPIASLERLAVIGTRTAGSAEELVVSWKVGSVWGEPVPLAAVSQLGDLDAASNERGNIIVVWRDGTEIWSRVYTRANGEWEPALRIATTTPDAIIGDVAFVDGSALVPFNSFDTDSSTWAAVYQDGIGWIESAKIRLDPEWTGGAVGVALDAEGNGLAVWAPEGGPFKYRRYIAGEGWRTTLSAGFQINPYYVWTVAGAGGSFLVVSNELVGSENHAPWAVHFE